MVRESGVLHKVPATPAAEVEVEEHLLSPLTEEIFNAMTLIIPHAFLLLMMEMYVRWAVSPARVISYSLAASYTTNTADDLHGKP